MEILEGNVCVGAGNDRNLFTIRENIKGAGDEKPYLEVVGEYHLGGYVNRFRHDSPILMQLENSETLEIPTVKFGTVDGSIGIIASLPHDIFSMLEKLQFRLQKEIEGVGGLSHEHWRSFYVEDKFVGAKNFLDGDLIQMFLDLSWAQMTKISNEMNFTVEELKKIVEGLTPGCIKFKCTC